MFLKQAALPDAFDECPVGEGRCPRDAAWCFTMTALINIALIKLEQVPVFGLCSYDGARAALDLTEP
jgi:hypothetical protein